MRFTAKGRETLDRYLAEVRAAVSVDPDVDAADVADGIREHVETELARRSVTEATGEDVAEVLAALGPARALAEGGEGPAGPHQPFARPVPILSWVAVGLFAVGIGLWSTNAVVGAVCVVAGAAVARVAVSEPEYAGPGAALAAMVWAAFIAGVWFTLILGPAVLVWAQAQTGGILEGPLARLSRGATAADGGRPAAYWLVMGSAAAAVTGVWWLVAGSLLHRYGDRVRTAISPARAVARPIVARGLVVGGALALLLSLILGFLSW